MESGSPGRGGNVDIVLVDATSGETRKLTTDPAADQGPVWSPDGMSITF